MAVQVDPMKPTLKAPGIRRLKLKYAKPLSNFALKFNLRRYNLDFDRFLESLLEGVVSLFKAIFMGRDNTKPRAGQRDDARYKSKASHVADDKVDDYDYEDETAGLGSRSPAPATPEQKLAARLGLGLDPPPVTEGVYARAAASHSATGAGAGAGDPHGAVYHAALGAHRTLVGRCMLTLSNPH